MFVNIYKFSVDLTLFVLHSRGKETANILLNLVEFPKSPKHNNQQAEIVATNA